MTKQWSIVFANSSTHDECKRLANELANRLGAKLETYDSDCDLRFSEGALPFTLGDIIQIIPAGKIRAVTLDTRHDGQQLKLQYGVNMMSTKGFLYFAYDEGGGAGQGEPTNVPDLISVAPGRFFDIDPLVIIESQPYIIEII